MIIKSHEIPKIVKGHWSTRGLAGYWPMMPYEVFGSKVFDLSGNGKDGDFGAGAAAPIWSPGKLGSAVKFPGNNYIDFGVVDWPGTDDFTVIIWFNTSQSTNWRAFDTRGKGVVGIVKGIQLSYGSTSHWANTIIDDGAGSYVRATGIDQSWGLDGQWHQLAVVFHNASGKAEFYTDDVLGDTDTDVGLIGANFTVAKNLIMGANTNGLNDHFLTGLLDIPSAYNRALSAGEIAKLFRNPLLPIEREPIELWVGATSVGVAPLSLAGSISAQSTVTGAIGSVETLKGSIDAQATVEGDTESVEGLQGSISGQSTVDGKIDSVEGLAGSVSGQAVITGNINSKEVLQGSVAAQSTVAGNLVLYAPAAGHPYYYREIANRRVA